ncbi:helix-turn-helix transcriptional regulator [Lysinibacillus sp. FSL W8-0992]|uniref:helix-turn-helix transcriptional regulator n=1 Tax=Lysinibacillus sp. FSL W8-0992 TaxID=2954643 RepID=UPI0030FA85AA
MKLNAHQIKQYREVLGITQGELSRKLGISSSTLGAIEREERRLSDAVASRASSALLEASRRVMAATEEIQTLADALQK